MPITDEDVLRELLHRATDDLHAPPAVTAGIVTRHHRRLRNTRILSITTTGVAAAAVVAAVAVTRVGPSAPSLGQHPAALPATELPATELPPVKLTAMQVLDQLSVAAARAPQPADRYIALTQIMGGIGPHYADMTIFDALTGDVWSYVHGSNLPSESPVSTHWSPTRAEFAAWPTNPAKLRALLLTPGVPAVGLGEVFKNVIPGEAPTAWSSRRPPTGCGTRCSARPCDPRCTRCSRQRPG